MKRRLVVIGAGLAGTLLCNELAGFFDVTLLERGSKDSVVIPEVKFVNKAFAEVPTFCYGGGGTTNLWHNGLIPINTGDITNQVFRKVLADSRRFMDQAASALFFTEKPYQTEYENLVGEINSLSHKLSVFPYGLDCLIYPKKFRKLTIGPRVSEIYNVEDIDFVLEGRNIRAINFWRGRRKQSVSADALIVCAGALGTPGILKKIMAAAGLADDKAGRCLIDHPMGFVGKVKFKKDVSGLFKKLSIYDKGHYISRNGVRLKSACGRYTACAYFRPALTMGNSLRIHKYRSSLGASSGVARLKNAFSVKLFHPDILAEIVAHLFGVYIPGRTYNILFVGEQKRGSNRVIYKGDELHVDWSISSQELAAYRDMLKGLQRMLESLTDEMNIKTRISDDWLWSMAHHSGTVSLGVSEDDLIGRDLNLKCCDNAYICDGSVIQEHSYANTGLAIGQLAFRLAERVRCDFHG